MIYRHVLRGVPSQVAGPFDTIVTVEIISMSKVEDNTEASMCWIEEDKTKCTPGKGVPLEPGTKLEVDLAPGNILWGVTREVGLFSVSVKGYRGR